MSSIASGSGILSCLGTSIARTLVAQRRRLAGLVRWRRGRAGLGSARRGDGPGQDRAGRRRLVLAHGRRHVALRVSPKPVKYWLNRGYPYVC